MPQVTPIKGFNNTPVTRSICICSTIITLALLIFSLKQYLLLAIDPFVVLFSQYWRVVTFQLSVANESDFVLSIVLWFQFKTLERFFGPKKYLSLIVLFTLYNAVVTFLVMSLGQLTIVGSWAAFKYMFMRLDTGTPYFQTVFNAATPGPLGILSLLYVCYTNYIPTTYLFKILLRKPNEGHDSENRTARGQTSAGAGANSSPSSNLIFDFTLTSHFQVQILYTILILNHGFSSILPCLIGVLIGKLYTLDLLIGSKTCVLPTLVFELFVNPQKARRSATRSVTRILRGYQPISGDDAARPQSVVDHHALHDDIEDDTEMAIDDLRNSEETAAAHSATPVRPLGRRFLDTFRA